jgi:phosphohistidine swiveling domain-containing protein
MKNFDFDDILKRVKNNIAKQHHKDELFRMNIVLSQLGDLAHFITHDQKINPKARVYKTDRHEEDSFGHAFVQLIMLARIRNIDIKKSIEHSLRNLEDLDWQKKERVQNKLFVSGDVAQKGEIEGVAFVDKEGNNLYDLDDHILVTDHVSPDLVIHISRIKGIITNHGGKYSHAAIIAREYNIPCIVATESATELIKHGQRIKISANDRGEVHILQV